MRVFVPESFWSMTACQGGGPPCHRLGRNWGIWRRLERQTTRKTLTIIVFCEKKNVCVIIHDSTIFLRWKISTNEIPCKYGCMGVSDLGVWSCCKHFIRNSCWGGKQTFPAARNCFPTKTVSHVLCQRQHTPPHHPARSVNLSQNAAEIAGEELRCRDPARNPWLGMPPHLVGGGIKGGGIVTAGGSAHKGASTKGLG